ncbi:AzlD domain-containing protein [Faecalispora jeddahensis]|uniref:AzlD domain-containing protein n=1 Tax=Faecalispora jeddahensis TaxID=1414721 RepID=UPI0027BA5929|nr:AzlD domain-containing protein [Faecalispora jeddahensis]
MNTAYVVSCVLLMAGVTYVIRMLPMAVFQRRLENRFVRSFLAYVPYAVLSAMTFPQILYSAGGTAASAAGLLVAMVLAFRGRGLLVVALGAAAAALLTQQLLLAGLL